MQRLFASASLSVPLFDDAKIEVNPLSSKDIFTSPSSVLVNAGRDKSQTTQYLCELVTKVRSVVPDVHVVVVTTQQRTAAWKDTQLADNIQEIDNSDAAAVQSWVNNLMYFETFGTKIGIEHRLLVVVDGCDGVTAALDPSVCTSKNMWLLAGCSTLFRRLRHYKKFDYVTVSALPTLGSARRWAQDGRVSVASMYKIMKTALKTTSGLWRPSPGIVGSYFYVDL